MKRAEKLTLLGGLIQGQANQDQLQRFRDKKAPWYMVVANNGPIQPTDLVETSRRDDGSPATVSFAEFERNLAIYRPICIQVDEQKAI